jgi:hypothetical protein
LLRASDDVLVFGYVVIVFLLLVGPLAYYVGVDSRVDEVERRHRYLG